MLGVGGERLGSGGSWRVDALCVRLGDVLFRVSVLGRFFGEVGLVGSSDCR